MTSTTMTGITDVSFDETIPTSYVLDKAMREALREPFPPSMIGKVNKGFGMVDFIGHAAITDRLNQAAPGWTYRIEPVVITGKDGLPHVMAVFGTITIGGVTRQEVGDVEHMTRYGDELKKAISDFICRGAMRFGVGLDLWSKEDLSSRETPASGDSSSPSAEAGEKSAPRRGQNRGGADGGDGVDTTSPAPPDTSSAGRSRRGKARRPAGDQTSPGEPAQSTAPTGGSGADPGDKTYPIDPRDCLHTVGVDIEGKCVDCGTQMESVS